MNILTAIVAFFQAFQKAMDLVDKHEKDIADLKTRQDATDKKLEHAN